MQDAIVASFGTTSGSVEESATDLVTNTTYGTEAETRALVGVIDNEGITSNSGLPLDLDKAFVLKTEDDYSMLRVPFENTTNILNESGTSFYFDNDHKLVTHGEILLTEVSATSGNVEFWQDGVKLVDEFVAEPESDEGATTATLAFNWGTFNDCLSNAGIAAWAITAIGVACGAACAVTAGLGCIVCATGVAGITGGTIGHCAGLAMA